MVYPKAHVIPVLVGRDAQAIRQMLVCIGLGGFSLIVIEPACLLLGLASLTYLLLAGIPLIIVLKKLYGGIDSFVLLCIPGFVLARNLMNIGNITEQVVSFSNALLGHIRGRLGVANAGGSMIFGGISSTAVADAASIGSVMIPGMERAGYDNERLCAGGRHARRQEPYATQAARIASRSGADVGFTAVAGEPGQSVCLDTHQRTDPADDRRWHPQYQRYALGGDPDPAGDRYIHGNRCRTEHPVPGAAGRGGQYRQSTGRPADACSRAVSDLQHLGGRAGVLCAVDLAVAAH